MGDDAKDARHTLGCALIATPTTQRVTHKTIQTDRWKEQREAMMSKLRDTTRAGDDEITRNLVALTKTRPDIFGGLCFH